jgi:hypothetical protein
MLLILCLMIFKVFSGNYSWGLLSLSIITIPLLCTITWLLFVRTQNHAASTKICAARIQMNGPLYFFPQLYNVVFMWSPVLLMGMIFNDTDVVNYTLLIRLASMMSFAGLCFNYIFFPQITRLAHKRNFDAINLKLKDYSVLTIIFLIVVIVITSTFYYFGFYLAFFNTSEDAIAFIILILANINGLFFLPYLNIASLILSQRTIISITILSFSIAIFLFIVVYLTKSKYLLAFVVPTSLFFPHIFLFFKCKSILNSGGGQSNAI